MLASAFASLKEVIESSSHLSADALHVHIGLVLFLIGAALMRSERRFLYSLGWLLAICLVGELFDLSKAYSEGSRLRWLGSAKDLVNTMLWPAAWVFGSPLAARVLRLRAASIQPELQGTGK